MDFYNHARDFYQKYGHLYMTYDYKYNGIELGKWVSNQRKFANDKKVIYPTQKVDLLNAIGMIWNSFEYKWERGFSYAQKYYDQYGHLDVPSKYQIDDFKLGKWVQNQKTKFTCKYKRTGRLTEKQIERLNTLKIHWPEGVRFAESLDEE